MTTKLISMNVGIQLTLLVDGKQKMVTWSAVCPSESNPNPVFSIGNLCDFINEQFGTNYYVGDSSDHIIVSIAKPRKIKARRPVSQEEFNKRIKELQP